MKQIEDIENLILKYVIYNETRFSLEEWRDIMVEIKVLNHSVVIKGKSFEECKAEYDKICTGVKRDFSTQCNLEEIIFSGMTITDNECIVVFQIPENKIDGKCTCIGVTLSGEWKKYYERMKILDFLNSIAQ